MPDPLALDGGLQEVVLVQPVRDVVAGLLHDLAGGAAVGSLVLVDFALGETPRGAGREAADQEDLGDVFVMKIFLNK